MGFSHDTVAERWANGKKGTGKNVFSDGTTIYSYGYHFPIAHRLKDGTVLFNKTNYSASTSKHQAIVSRHCEEGLNNGKVLKCDTDTIDKAINDPDRPIIIEREKKLSGLHEGVEKIREFCKEAGVEYFPYDDFLSQFQELIYDWKDWEKEKKLGEIVYEGEDKNYGPWISTIKVEWKRGKRDLAFIRWGKQSDYSLKEVAEILIEEKIVKNTVPDEIKEILEREKRKMLARKI